MSSSVCSSWILWVLLKSFKEMAEESLQELTGPNACLGDRSLCIARCVTEIAAFCLFPSTACVFSFPHHMGCYLFLSAAGQISSPFGFVFTITTAFIISLSFLVFSGQEC